MIYDKQLSEDSQLKYTRIALEYTNPVDITITSVQRTEFTYKDGIKQLIGLTVYSNQV